MPQKTSSPRTKSSNNNSKGGRTIRMPTYQPKYAHTGTNGTTKDSGMTYINNCGTRSFGSKMW